MEIRQGKIRGGSPLLRELRRWERRSRRAERPDRARLAGWQQAVAAAQSTGDEESPLLAASLRTILRLGVESRLAGLEQLVDADRPLGSMLLTQHEALTMRADLDTAAALGSHVGRTRTALATLLAAQVTARLLALKIEAKTAGPAEAASLAMQAATLWGDLLEAEAQGATETVEIGERLSVLHRLLETMARTASANETEIADLAPTVFTLASRSTDLSQRLIRAWAERLTNRFAGRPGWDQFLAELRAMAEGRPVATTATPTTEQIGKAGRSPIPPALTQILAFVHDTDERVSGFLANLISERRAEIDHPRLEMPFLIRTEIQLDWLEGQPDPWQDAELVEKARAAATAMVAEGVRIEFVPGRALPADSYDDRLARSPADFKLLGVAGQLPLTRLQLLEKAMFVAQRPGRLEVVLPPAGTAMAGTPRAGLFAQQIGRALAGPSVGPSVGSPPASGQTVQLRLDWVAGEEPWSQLVAQRPGSLHVVLSPAASPTASQPGATVTMRVQLDWVAGQDPWQRQESLMQAREAARSLATSGVQLEFVRGREVPIAQYSAGAGLRAADFVVSGSQGPVQLGNVALLENAVLQGQGPDTLHVILAPKEGTVGTPAGLSTGCSASLYGVAPERPLLAHQAAEGATLPQSVFSGQPWMAQEQSAPVPGLRPPDAAGWAGKRLGQMPDRLSASLLELGRDLSFGAEPLPAVGRRGTSPRPTVSDLWNGALSASFRESGAAGQGGAAPAALPAQSVGQGLAPAALLSQFVGQGIGSDTTLSQAVGRGLVPHRPAPGELPSTVDASTPYPSSFLSSVLGSYQGSSSNPETDTSVHSLTLRDPSLWGAYGQSATGGVGDRDVTGKQPLPQDVRLELDWISGHDPWQHPAAITAAREAARQLESQGVQLEFVRGRELPAESYMADAGLPAGAFSTFGPAGPISLAELELLDRAVPVAQRPGLLHVVLAPTSRHGDAMNLSDQLARTGELSRPAGLSISSAAQLAGAPASLFTTLNAQFRTSDAVGRGLVPRRTASDVRPAAGDVTPPYFGNDAATVWNPAKQSGTEAVPVLAAAESALLGLLPAESSGLPGPLSVKRPQGAAPGSESANVDSHSSSQGWVAPRDNDVASAAVSQLSAMPLARDQLATALSNRSAASTPVGADGLSTSTGASPTPSTRRGSAAPSTHAGGGAEKGKPDMDALSRQVYAMIKQRLAVERERIGNRAGRQW